MQITVSTRTLANALSELAPIAARKTSLMVLNYIKVVVKGNRARLHASDGNVTVRKYIDLDSATEDGTFLVKGEDIAKYAGALSGDQCELEVSAESLNIKCGKSKARFATLDGNDFPEPENLTEPKVVVIPSAKVKELISVASRFVGNEIVHPQMMHIRVFVEGKKISYAATDSRKLFLDSFEVENDNPNVEFYIEQSTFGIVSKICAGASDMTISISENIITFRCGDNMVFSTQPKGNYPAIHRVIPKSHNFAMEAPKKELAEAIKRVSLTGNKSYLVKMQAEGMDCTFTSVNIEEGKEASDSVFCTIGQPITIGLHAEHFLTCLSAIDNDDAEIRFIDPSRQLVLADKKNPDRVILVMPMAIA